MSNFWRTAYREDGSALFYQGEGSVLEFQLQVEATSPATGWVDEDLSARVFVQSVIDREGAVQAETAGVVMTADGATFARLSIAHDVLAALLPAGASGVDFRHTVYELLADGGKDVVLQPSPFSVRPLDFPEGPPPDAGEPVVDGPVARFTLQRQAVGNPRLVVTQRGGRGAAARQDLGPLYWQGLLSGGELLLSCTLEGDVTWSEAATTFKAKRGATNQSTISVCRNGVYADPIHASSGEIAAALFATITFAAGGQGGKQTAVVAYVGGTPGVAVAGDDLDWWAPNPADPTLSFISGTHAGT